MIADEDELLIGANGDLGGLAGGRRGAEFAARRMRKNVLEVDLEVGMTPAAAARRAEEVLTGAGALIRSGPGADSSVIEVVGLVGAGFGGLNPAVVTVSVCSSDYGSRIVVRGAAKEGLIRQRAGEAAARRVADALA